MPRSKLLGRQTKSVTTTSKGPDGETVTETVWDSDWLEEDYAWAAAFLRWKAGKCPGCHLDMVDTTAMRDGDPVHVYDVPKPRRCHACDAKLAAQGEHAEKKVVRPEALLWHIEQIT